MAYQKGKRTDNFLDSFGEKITIWTTKTDETHKSIDHHSGRSSENNTGKASPFSIAPLSTLSKRAQQVINDYQTNGYVVIDDFFTPEQVSELQRESRRVMDAASFGTNEFSGLKTKRAYALLAKTRALDCWLAHPLLTEITSALFAPNPLVSALQMIEIFPGEIAQKLHYDQQFQNPGESTRGDDNIVNFIMAIDDFTEQNGATVVIPGSHKWPGDRTPSPEDRREKLVMKAGGVCLFSGNLWHGGGANQTDGTRRAVISAFCQPWLRPLENNFLAVPFSVAVQLDRQIQSYMGYSLHHPFVGHADSIHPLKKLQEIVAQSKL